MFAMARGDAVRRREIAREMNHRPNPGDAGRVSVRGRMQTKAVLATEKRKFAGTSDGKTDKRDSFCVTRPASDGSVSTHSIRF
jgi:hypothetical protein